MSGVLSHAAFGGPDGALWYRPRRWEHSSPWSCRSPFFRGLWCSAEAVEEQHR